MITWRNVTVKLSTLKPWEHNPRTMTKAQAKRLLKSWNELGQFQTIAIGPDGQVYDGHQRLSALLTAYGAAYQIEARQSDRALTDEERQALTLAANIGAGAWNWDVIASWPVKTVTDWGMDKETLAQWNNDSMNLREMLNADLPTVDPTEEWEGMPEFEQEDLSAYKSIHVNFTCQDDYETFATLVGQKLTDKTRSIWFPPVEKINMTDTYERIS